MTTYKIKCIGFTKAMHHSASAISSSAGSKIYTSHAYLKFTVKPSSTDEVAKRKIEMHGIMSNLTEPKNSTQFLIFKFIDNQSDEEELSSFSIDKIARRKKTIQEGRAKKYLQSVLYNKSSTQENDNCVGAEFFNLVNSAKKIGNEIKNLNLRYNYPLWGSPDMESPPLHCYSLLFSLLEQLFPNEYKYIHEIANKQLIVDLQQLKKIGITYQYAGEYMNSIQYKPISKKL